MHYELHLILRKLRAFKLARISTTLTVSVVLAVVIYAMRDTKHHRSHLNAVMMKQADRLEGSSEFLGLLRSQLVSVPH